MLERRRKVGESFEDLLWRHGIPKLWIVTREAFFAVDEFGDYKIPYVQGAWLGFKLGSMKT